MLCMHPNLAGARAEQLGPAFDELKAFIVTATGHARLAKRDDLLLEKISRRISAHNLPSLESYLDLLTRGANGRIEFDCLIAELTIGETSFFRHQEHFDALRDQVLPACLRRNGVTRQLRIWSAGCANGAEVYSIAIVVHALLGHRRDDWNVVIVGSDINRAFLAEAEAGRYSAWTLRDVAEEQREALFVRNGDGWTIREAYRRDVRFVYHNLVSDEFPCFHKNIFAFDIIMCRNVMIYFDALNNKQLAERLGTVLTDDGWLFTGPADFNPHLESILTLEKLSGALVYRNRLPRTQSRQALSIASPAKPPAERTTPDARRAPPARDRSTAGRSGRRRRIRDSIPPRAQEPSAIRQPTIEKASERSKHGLRSMDDLSKVSDAIGITAYGNSYSHLRLRREVLQ